ncbi:hypothetical protein BDR03DRAFT_862403, partial [Suillus americanus]
ISMTASPHPYPGYAVPITPTSSSTFPPGTSSSKIPPRPKPVNVFSNDGSFLERFQRSKKEQEDKRKAEEALARKRQFDNRFRKRGKRPQPDSSSTVTQGKPTKKVKVDGASSCEYAFSINDLWLTMRKDALSTIMDSLPKVLLRF